MKYLYVAVFAVVIPAIANAELVCGSDQYACGPGICCPK